MDNVNLTQEIAQEAFSLIMPSIEHMTEFQRIKYEHLYFVILNPTYTGPVLFNENAILFEKTIESSMESPDFAQAEAQKLAQMVYRTGYDVSEIRSQKPWLMVSDDPISGGAINHEGIIVACFGEKESWCELFALWLASACVLLSREKALRENTTKPNFDVTQRLKEREYETNC